MSNLNVRPLRCPCVVDGDREDPRLCVHERIAAALELIAARAPMPWPVTYGTVTGTTIPGASAPWAPVVCACGPTSDGTHQQWCYFAARKQSGQ